MTWRLFGATPGCNLKNGAPEGASSGDGFDPRNRFGRGSTPLSKTQWRRWIQEHVDSKEHYLRLESSIGHFHAELFLDIHADGFAIRNGRPLDKLTPEIVARYIRIETSIFTACNGSIGVLWDRVETLRLQNHGLRDSNNVLPEQDYYRFPLGQPDKMPRLLLNIDRAANWICGAGGDTYNTPELREKVRNLLDYHVTHGSKGHTLGPTGYYCRHLQACMAPEAPLYRCAEPGASYPSTAGGSRLLELIFRSIAARNKPPFDSPLWEDHALFLLGSIMCAGGFADGNKRVARTVYAIVLLRNTKTFVAPTVEFEQRLFRRGAVAGRATEGTAVEAWLGVAPRVGVRRPKPTLSV